MMCKTRTMYSAIVKNEIQVDQRFTEGVSRWGKFDKMSHSWVSSLGWGLIYFSVYAEFATYWWLWLLLSAQWLLSPIHGAIINWYAHK